MEHGVHSYISVSAYPEMQGSQARFFCAQKRADGGVILKSIRKNPDLYLVREEDVLAYAERADEIILPPVFSSAAGSPRRKDPDQRIRKSAFLQIWAKEPDALTPADVQRVTGYTGSTVRQWIRKGKLRAVTVQGRSLVAKEWLAEFMAGYGMRIWQKSEVHRRMLSLIRHR